MPEIDGFTVCSEMRRLRPSEFLPIIMVTGSLDSDILNKAFESGATDFTSRPINWLKLKNRLRYLMNARLNAKDLLSTENQHNALLDAIPDTLLRINLSGVVLDVKSSNDDFDATKFGLIPGSCFHELLPVPYSVQVREAVFALVSGDSIQQFEFIFEQQGQRYFLDVRMVAAGDSEVIVMLRDFSQRHQAEAEIRKLAYYDQVSGLPNLEMTRKEITKQVSSVADNAGMVSVIRMNMLGLDSAKSVLGIDRSNDLLRILAKRLKVLVIQEADVCDEHTPVVGCVSEAGFAIVRNDIVCKEDMYDFAVSLQQRMADKVLLGSYEVNLTSRVGVAVYPDDDKEGSCLLDKAEVVLEQACRTQHTSPLLYSAKLAERNRYRINLSKKLQNAVDNGDLHLDYQPKVDTYSRNIIGVEALLRWHTSDGSSVLPAEFIPLAEENGLILPIGEFVLYEACQQSRRWADAGCRMVPIAVNFSGHQFNQTGLIKNILNMLEFHGVQKTNIEVELTESVALESSTRVQSILSELKDLGIRTAIDDFGTGYSSLSSLRKFPFHTLKVDRSFVMDLNRTLSAGSIVEGIIKMGHALGMKVVAEGVEEEHQLQFLRDLNCDVIQGYLTGRPLPPGNIQALLS